MIKQPLHLTLIWPVLAEQDSGELVLVWPRQLMGPVWGIRCGHLIKSGLGKFEHEALSTCKHTNIGAGQPPTAAGEHTGLPCGHMGMHIGLPD